MTTAVTKFIALSLAATTGAGAVGSAAEAATTAVVDRFLVQRNSPPSVPTPVTLYADEFSNGLVPQHLIAEPVGGGAFANGSPGLYGLSGLFPAGAEINNRLTLDPSNGALVTNATGVEFMRLGAVLLTSNNPAVLGPTFDFSVRGRFDLVTPVAVNDAYGIELNDIFDATNLGNDRLQLLVRRSTQGDALIQLISQRFDPAGGTVQFVAAVPFAPPVGTTQLALQLVHVATDPGAVQGAFLWVNELGNVYDPAAMVFTNVPVTTAGADQYRTFLPGGEVFKDEGFARGGFLVVQQVPEPGTYAMLLAGLGILGWMARRRMKA